MEYGIHPRSIINVKINGDSEKIYIGPNAIIGYDYSTQRAVFHNKSPNIPPQIVSIGNRVFIGPNTIVSSGSSIGNETIIEHNCFIGEDAIIGENCFIRYQAQIFRRVKIGNHSVVSGFLCNDTVIENNVTFHGATIHRVLDKQIGKPEPSPQICTGSFVGFNVTIIGPVTIGPNAVIKTGATILSSVPEGKTINTGQVYNGK